MKQLEAIIVDDEPLARENLKMLLEAYCPEVLVVGMAGGITEAQKKIENLQPEVVFLDIRMPSGAEGFELLDTIEKKNFQVVFVTAFKDYAIRALNASAIHYLLKPIDIDDLKYAVKKLVEYKASFSENNANFEAYSNSLKNLGQWLQQKTEPQKLTLYHAKGFKVIDVEDIVRIEADNNCSAFYFENGEKYLDTKTLKIYEELLSRAHFLRVHKSHLINLRHLKEYINQEGHEAIMSDGEKIPVARARLSHFLTAAKNLG